MRNEALQNAIVAAGGVSKLAAALGVSSQAISQWDEVPANRVLATERATNGQVTRSQLRPDLYPLDDEAGGQARTASADEAAA